MNINHFKIILGLNRGIPLSKAFGYNSPVRDIKSFYHRDSLSRQFENCIRDSGSQILIYGKPLVGKTSLVESQLRTMGLEYVRIRCLENMKAPTLIRRCLLVLGRWLPGTVTTKETSETRGNVGVKLGINIDGGGTRVQTTERVQHPPLQELTVFDLIDAMRSRERLLFVDDTERTTDDGFWSALRDLAKELSDMETFSAPKVIYSIATEDRARILSLLKPRLNRLRLIHVPPMTDTEIRGLIRHGAAITYLNLSEDVIDETVRLSDGIPRTAKLLCYEAGIAIAKMAGIDDQRLTGNEPPVDLIQFRSEILPDLQARGLI